MRQLLFIALTTFIVTQSIIAQTDIKSDNFTFSMGTSYTLPAGYNGIAFLGNQDIGYFQFSKKWRSQDMWTHKFDASTLKYKSKSFMTFPTDVEYYITEYFLELNGAIHLVYSYYNKSTKEEHLKVRKLNTSTTKFSPTKKNMINTKTGIAPQDFGSVFSMAARFGSAYKYNFKFTDDDEKVLVNYRAKSLIKKNTKNKDILGFYVFDKEFEKIWGKEFTMPYVEANMVKEDYEIDNSGNAYLLAKVFEDDEQDNEDDEPNYHYELMKFSKDSEQPQIIKVDAGTKFISDIAMGQYGDDELLLSGLYSEDKKANSVDGAFTFIINSDGKANNNFHPYPAEIIAQNSKNKKKADTEEKQEKGTKKGKELDGFRTNEVIIGEDGSMVINSEKFKMVTYSTYSDGRWTNYTKTFYGNIISMKIDADGKMEWAKNIGKNQIDVNPRGKWNSTSYKYFNHQDDNYFIFIDNIKNIDIEAGGKAAAHVDNLGGYLVAVKIDKDGNMSKESILNVRDFDDLVFDPDGLTRVSDNCMIGRAFAKPGGFGYINKATKSKLCKVCITE